MLIRLVMVMTADGVIAKDAKHNPMDWTSKEDKALFRQTSKEAGVIIMGQSTFDAIGGALPNRLNIVLTRENRIDNPGILEHKSGDLQTIILDLEKRGYQKALVCGGTFVNSAFLQIQLLDEIQITVEPRIFGQGLRLFDKVNADLNMQLLEVNKLNDNTINLLYKIIK
jgi:dihydrofolate reductase